MKSFDRILQALTRPAPVAHAPAFRVEETEFGYDLHDGALHLGFVFTADWFFFDLWRFSPFQAPFLFNERAHPHVIDMHTQRNSQINLAGIRKVGEAPESVAHEWSPGGGEIRLTVTVTYSRGQRQVFVFRASYDPIWGRYRYHFDADAWKVRADGHEPLNMMMCGALHSRADRRRWSHSVWADPHGQLRRLVHSNALFSATDFGHDDYGPAWRSKLAPQEQAWMMYAGGDDPHSPAMLVHHCNVPMYWSTCSQLFDEHFIWQDAGYPQLEDGLFHFAMHTEYVDVPKALADELFAAAVDPEPPRQWRFRRAALPLRMDVVNDLEREVDLWEAEDCPLWVVDFDPEAPVSWADGEAYSGERSIRLAATERYGTTSVFPSGAVCNCESEGRYRFRAMVKTRGVRRFARLSLSTYEYVVKNPVDTAQSAKLAGDSDWRELVVELESDGAAYMLPRLELYGDGEAFFDDVQFTRV